MLYNASSQSYVRQVQGSRSPIPSASVYLWVHLSQSWWSSSWPNIWSVHSEHGWLRWIGFNALCCVGDAGLCAVADGLPTSDSKRKPSQYVVRCQSRWCSPPFGAAWLVFAMDTLYSRAQVVADVLFKCMLWDSSRQYVYLDYQDTASKWSINWSLSSQQTCVHWLNDTGISGRSRLIHKPPSLPSIGTEKLWW